MSTNTEQGKVTSVLDLPDDQIANLNTEDFAETVSAEPESEETSHELSDSETNDDVVSDEGEVITPVEDGVTEYPLEEEKTEPNNEHTSFYEAVTAPFKANGVNVQVKDPSEVIRLMQMGANYSKKMADLKQPRVYIKMLEDAKLLDPEKLGFLIDVHNKNPEAIAKLIRDSGLDTYDIDSEDKANQYKQITQAPTNATIDLQDVISEVEHTPTYARLMQVVVDTFDEVSRSRIASEPSALKLLNEHMGNGIYDQINEIVQSERALGRLAVPDIEAYTAVGNYLHQNGLLVTQKTEPVELPSNKPDTSLNARRQAASSPQGKPSASPVETKSPLSMSDEEFASYMANRV